MKRRSLALALATSLALLAPLTAAESSSEAKRLRDLAPKAEKYSVTVGDSNTRAGAARVFVRAPATVTQKTVTDYANYAQMIRSFDQARVVGQHGSQTDVYMKVPILRGLASIWAIMRFDPPKQIGQGEYLVEARMVEGNVKKFNAVYRIKEIDEQTSQLNLEMHIVPKMPGVPGSLVTQEVSKASDRAVRRLRDGAQRRFQG